jgi:glycosyltransferase involved in cell wall biosynthesis
MAMKIALLCDGPVPHSRMNYRGEVFLRLLPGGGHTVYLVAMGDIGAKDLRNDVTLFSHSCGHYTPIAGIRSFPFRLWQILRMFIATKRVLRQDVELIRSIATAPTIVAVLARGRGTVPILANASDFYGDLYTGGKLPFRRVAIWLIRRLERLCARADYLIVDTPDQRVRWMTRGVKPSRCVVVPHGLPRSWLTAAQNSEPPTRNENEARNSLTLFYVGDISEMDGLDVLIASMRRLRDDGLPVRLLIIGKGTDAYWRELDRLIRRLSLVEFVEHIASVPNEELPAIIDRISVCVAPFRLQETSSTSIPNKVLEYLAGSRPIVVPAGSVLQHIFGSAFSYFTPGDSVSLAQAVETALASQREALPLRLAIQNEMRWPSVMQQEWALIKSILAGQVGDARRFDFRLDERLTNAAATLAARRTHGGFDTLGRGHWLP